jgi:hypothetical protein
MQAEPRDLERAVATGTQDAGRGLRTELRRQVTRAGLGQRLANSWRDRHYPNRKLERGGPGLHQGAADHPRVRRGGADPEEARVVPGDPDRERTEERHRRQTHQPEHISGAPVRPLRFVRRLSGPSLLVVDGLRASFSRHTGDLRGFRRAMGRARQRLGVIYGGCGEPIAQRLSRPWMLALRLSRPPAARRCRGRGFGKRCCCP